MAALRMGLRKMVGIYSASRRYSLSICYKVLCQQSEGSSIHRTSRVTRTLVTTHSRFAKSTLFKKRKAKEEPVIEDFDLSQFTEDQVNDLISDILAEAAKIDVMVQTVNKLSTKDLVLYMLQMGWTPDMIRNVLVKNHALLHLSKSKVVATMDLLFACGFVVEQMAGLMESGAVDNLSKNRLMESIETLLKLGMRDGKVQSFIAENPEVLTHPTRNIEKRVEELKSLFKTDDVVPIVMAAPNVLSDDWQKILRLFHYVFSEMGIKQRQMVTSNLFKYPLDYVRIRHLFVWKAGFYIKPQKEDDPVRKTNPNLKDILDTSDEIFARMFGDMSVQDYQTFSAMMKREFAEEKRQEDDDSDDDYDEK